MSIQSRTGDTSAQSKLNKEENTHPAWSPLRRAYLLFSYPETREAFSDLRAVIVDEWHELLSSKRGTQTELCLARLRKWNPGTQNLGAFRNPGKP